MRKMQEKMLAAFEDAAVRAELEAVVQYDWGNTGHVYFQRGFDTLLDLQFAFNQETCSLSLSGLLVERAGLADNPPEWRVHDRTPETVDYHSLKYNDGQRVKAMFDMLDDLLADDVPAEVA